MLPSKSEQEEIIYYLDDKLHKIDEIIVKNNRSLELLKERRTAFISAAVTGKIDVRDWKASSENKEVIK
ncbi:MAG: hypothetical protein PF450_07545 [Bacteroidales bacterium]|jgi:type I restriction enzyme S subunit|nr:hypothetical protein [Bacteroidales bacterium]